MKNTYYVYGNHSVNQAIQNPKRIIVKILISENYNYSSLVTLLKKNTFTKNLIEKIKIVTNKDLFSLLGDNANHQGIAILTEELHSLSLEQLLNKSNLSSDFTLAVLDQVTDPHNIGAILRSAAAFNIDAIIMPKYNNAKENSTIAKISSGALEVVPLIQVTNLSNTLKILKKHNFWVIGLDSNSTSVNINTLNDFNKVALVFGNESKGLRTLTKSFCDVTVKIPFMHKNIESLNLSNAAAITFYLRYNKNQKS